MTTMAYHHESRTVAVDSRCTSGGLINTDNAKKVHQVDATTFVLAGRLSDIGVFVKEYPNVRSDISCSGFCIEGSDISAIVFSKGKLDKVELDFNEADGSGCDFALAAMDYGATAKEAVNYAKTRDAFTGGKVIVIKLPKKES